MKPWFMLSNRPKHIVLGLAIHLGTLAFGLIIGLAVCEAMLMALLTAMTAAVTKEYTDRLHGSVFDVLDAVATVLLPLVLTLLTIIIRMIWLL